MFSFSAPISSEGGHTSFLNNVPDPATSGRRFADLQIRIGKVRGPRH